MIYKKCLTAKQRLNAVLVLDENETKLNIIVESNGILRVYGPCSYIIPSLEKGNTQEFVDKFLKFDTEPFIKFYENYLIEKEEKRLKAIAEERITEENRISSLKKRILSCENPRELSEEFGITIVEVAGHWSDLYNGRSSYAFLLPYLDQVEIVELAVELHGIYGDFGELCRRDGEHHSTFNEHNNLKRYQNALKNHFNGNDYFQFSQESEKESYCERIREAAEENNIDKVMMLVKEYENLEDGYYDCNRIIQISSLDLESPKLTGYREDVYSYCFGFTFDNKYSFKRVDEDGEN